MPTIVSQGASEPTNYVTARGDYCRTEIRWLISYTVGPAPFFPRTYTTDWGLWFLRTEGPGLPFKVETLVDRRVITTEAGYFNPTRTWFNPHISHDFRGWLRIHFGRRDVDTTTSTYEVYSTDAGKTWSEPVRVFGMGAGNRTPELPTLAWDPVAGTVLRTAMYGAGTKLGFGYFHVQATRELPGNAAPSPPFYLTDRFGQRLEVIGTECDFQPGVYEQSGRWLALIRPLTLGSAGTTQDILSTDNGSSWRGIRTFTRPGDFGRMAVSPQNGTVIRAGLQAVGSPLQYYRINAFVQRRGQVPPGDAFVFRNQAGQEIEVLGTFSQNNAPAAPSFPTTYQPILGISFAGRYDPTARLFGTWVQKGDTTPSDWFSHDYGRTWTRFS